jgi:hypothetical protein
MDVETERFLTLFWDLEAVATKPWEFPTFVDRVLADLNPRAKEAGAEPAAT